VQQIRLWNAEGSSYGGGGETAILPLYYLLLAVAACKARAGRWAEPLPDEALLLISVDCRV